MYKFDPYSVECPLCRSKINEICRTSSGKGLWGRPHKCRKKVEKKYKGGNMCYKVIHSEFNGYRKMIFHNVNQGYFFYEFSANFHPMWNQTSAEIIAMCEENAEKFYTLEDCEEFVGRIVEKMCGYTKGEIPMDQYSVYNTFQVSSEDVEDYRREVKI